MSHIANEKMVELAALQRKIDHGLSSTTVDLRHFERALAEFTGHDFIIMSLAVSAAICEAVTRGYVAIPDDLVRRRSWRKPRRKRLAQRAQKITLGENARLRHHFQIEISWLT